MIFRAGDRVKIVDTGGLYSTATRFANKLGLKFWKSGFGNADSDEIDGQCGKIISDFTEGGVRIYGVHLDNGHDIIINNEYGCIELVALTSYLPDELFTL